MIARAIARLRRDPGIALCLLALVLAAALYAPTVGGRLLAHDDRWLYADNWIVRDASATSLHAIGFDLSRPIRGVLGAEYLPVRDAVALVEHAAWGTWWPGFHAVNVALDLAAIALWFAAFVAFGIDRRVAGLAVLLWAVHPTRVESVAWLAEQKGLLALVLVAASALGYARYRAGGGARWLVVAAIAAVAGVWSKAPAAFAIAAFAPIELIAPAPRASRRRALQALAALAVATAAAFVPVVVVATRLGVVGGGDRGLAVALAGHGFYLRLASLAMPNAAAYSFDTSALDIALGALGLAACAIAVARAPAAVRIGCVLWLAGWFPVSRLALPVQRVVVADRYLELGTLGVGLVVAAGICALASSRARIALSSAIVLACSLRTLAARDAWHDDVALWARVVRLEPGNGDAWARYSEALDAAGEPFSAQQAIAHGLEHDDAPRLLVDAALAAPDAATQRALLRRAAEAGDPFGMTDYALVLDAERDPGALDWARRALAVGGEHVELEVNLCRIALAAGQRAEALAACDRAYAMRPGDPIIAVHRARAAQ